MKRRVLIPIVEAGATILPPGYNLMDIPGFNRSTKAAVLSTACACNDDYPENCWFGNYLTVAASALKGTLVPFRR
jgi:hypothetical protein